MKCPHCAAAGRASFVYVGPAFTEAVYAPPYFDEDGKMHHHDSARSVSRYECSRGHEWEVRAAPIPCWCGWLPSGCSEKP